VAVSIIDAFKVIQVHHEHREIMLITRGATNPQTTPNDREFRKLLQLVEAAVAAEVSLIQLREKTLSARVLFELTVGAVAFTKESNTQLLVNDRFDIALAAGADGVHLTSTSLPSDIVRENCGNELLIGVSTHSLNEARLASERGVDFVVFGPVFETESKREYGEPLGTEKLREVTTALGQLPVMAIGGVSVDNAGKCFAAGAVGVAAIGLFHDPSKLSDCVASIRKEFKQHESND
jgi:thiamine-phosphate pyrophosphorylase